MQEKLGELLSLEKITPPAVLAITCTSAATIVLWKWMAHRSIQKKMEEARRWRDDSLEQMEKVIWKLKQKNPGVQSEFILSLPLTELAVKLKEESLSPESVLYTYIKKALEVTQEVNCVTDFIHNCEEQVQEVKRQKEKGLLYGVPVSIKDHIGCKGHISTGGLVQFLSRVETDDSVIVKVLKKQGAIPFVKTNIPQSMINYDCSNLIFGPTVHPLNHKKSPGGSSGGEGALIAAGGSLLGFGTDVAGSIRLPSSFCGICGLKPTGSRLRASSQYCKILVKEQVSTMAFSPNREGITGLWNALPEEVMTAVSPDSFKKELDKFMEKKGIIGYHYGTLGLASPIAGMKSVTATIGPMARDVDSLALCMKALLCDELFHLDPSVPPIPFKEEIYNSSKPLRIGYYEDDGYFEPSPSMRRAVRETKHLLQSSGHTLIPFEPPRVSYVVDELFTRGLYADGAATLVEKFKGDIVDPNLKSQMNCYSIPIVVKRILAFILKPVYPRIARDLSALCGVGSTKNLWKHHAAVAAYREEFLAEWRKLKLDVILCPVLGPAFNEGYPGKLFAATSYTNLYNVLNFPAGIVPVSKVTKADEEELKHYKGHYGDPWDKRLKEAVKDAVGFPVAVQCVALPWQEELCLRFMKEVETLVQERKAKN